MAMSLDDKLVVAISSRALFDFEEENRVFESGDAAGYMRLQLERLDQPAKPGIAFSLIRKLLAFNDTARSGSRWWCSRATTRCRACACSARPRPTASTCSAACSRRAARPSATCGRCRPPVPVGQRRRRAQALAAGFPAARVLTESVLAGANYPNEVRIAFDGDAVLFSDEAEQVFQARARGLPAARVEQGHPAAARRAVQAAAARCTACSRPATRRCASAPRWSRRAARRRTSAPSAR
jgi:5'-nucleotidase